MTPKHFILLVTALKILPMAYPPARKKAIRLVRRAASAIARRR